MPRIATVQTRGRVTLPALVRQTLGIAPGDNVVFVQTAAGRFEVKAEARTAALLNRQPTARLEVPVRRRAPQMPLPLPGSEHTSAP
jgi:AbrB family looped-hinge helix DNA binding protein